ncbi:MAG: DUF58 domain-containing protein [Planctomycetales bacterium 12-60-4]|nr:MAG: DUF58 domain-containing protein [Planctomycetales bacterium 12-60-4]
MFLAHGEPDALAGLKARLIVEGYLTGAHRSPYHGFSVEFAEHREYVPGDDLRYVDWKVFGKTDRIYLKQFDEETNFSCTILFDASESMTYRSDSAKTDKLEFARWVAAAIAYLVVRQHDAIGLATFDAAIRDFLRPASVASQFREVCHLLEGASGAGESAIGGMLQELAERQVRRGVVVVVSDFFDNFASLELGLRHLAFRRHDVLLLQVLDPAELDFPFQEPTRFRGLESWGELASDPRAVRKAYLKEFEQHLGRLRGLARELRFDYTVLRTDQPPTPALASLLSLRRQRRGA